MDAEPDAPQDVEEKRTAICCRAHALLANGDKHQALVSARMMARPALAA